MLLLYAVIAVAALTNAELRIPKGRKMPKQVVYYRRAEAGNYKLTSLDVAEKICTDAGDRLATIIELKKFAAKYGLQKCGEGSCGYVYKGRVRAVGCGAAPVNVTECPSDPAQHEKKGYDVWCFGPYKEDSVDKVAKPASIGALCLVKMSVRCATQFPYTSRHYKRGSDCAKKLCAKDPQCAAFIFNPENGKCGPYKERCPAAGIRPETGLNYYEYYRNQTTCLNGTKV